jgi:hypothetical protein
MLRTNDTAPCIRDPFVVTSDLREAITGGSNSVGAVLLGSDLRDLILIANPLPT